MQVKTYYGGDKSREECTALVMNKIAPVLWWTVEADLRQTKWFDYRNLSPAQATYLFAEEYRVAYRNAFARTKDLERSVSVNPFAPDDIFQSRELTAMWQARQAADGIGCKYDFYLRFVFTRFADRGWRYFPRPNQIASEELVLDIVDAWQIECRASLQLASSAFYKAAEYAELPEQVAYHEWLVKQIKVREHPYLALARLVYDEPILPETVAVQCFPPEVMRKARLFRT